MPLWLQGITTNWLSDIIRVGALAVITWLLGRANKKYPNWHATVRDYLTLFAFVAITWFALTGQGILQSHVTPDNIDGNVKAWVASANWGLTRLLPFESGISKIDLEDGHAITVRHIKENERYLEIDGAITVDEAVFKSLSQDQQTAVKYQVIKDLATVQVGFQLEDKPTTTIIVRRQLPITAELTGDKFIEACLDVEGGITVAASSFALAMRHEGGIAKMPTVQ
jgi:hypothetical protein